MLNHIYTHNSVVESGAPSQVRFYSASLQDSLHQNFLASPRSDHCIILLLHHAEGMVVPLVRTEVPNIWKAESQLSRTSGALIAGAASGPGLLGSGRLWEVERLPY